MAGAFRFSEASAPRQELAGQRVLGLDERGDRPLEDDAAAVVARARTDVEHPVGARDDIEVVLDDDDRLARLDQPLEQAHQVLNVLHVQTRSRLIEDVDVGVSAHLDGQLQALAFAA